MSGIWTRSRRPAQAALGFQNFCFCTLVAGILMACSDSATPAGDAGTPPEAAAETAADVTVSEAAADAPGVDAPAAPLEAGADAFASPETSVDSGELSPDDASAPRDATFAQDASDAGNADPYPGIMMSYRSWHALTDKPYDISAEIFGLCRLPTSAENEFATSVHSRYGLLDWANPTARANLDADTPAHFAPGSVIVKEKYASRDGGAPAVAALGIMLKQSSGFDPAHGDWEFAYWDQAQGLRKDSSGACGSCHDSSSAIDYVFIDDHWRRSDAGL
jgi:hypothetical protein